MSSLEETLNLSSDIVKIIGAQALPNGETIDQFLTINDISYWDIFSVDMARVYVPPCLLGATKTNFRNNFIKPILIRFRNFVRDKLELLQSTPNGNIKINIESPIAILDFSNHISRDVISPLVKFIREDCHNNANMMIDCKGGYGARHHDDHINIWSHWGSDLNAEYQSVCSEIDRRINILINEWDLKRILDRYQPNLYKVLSPALNRFFYGEIYSLIRRALLAKKTICLFPPKVLVVGDVANPKTRLYLALCKKKSIPTLALQFGMAGPASIEWKFLTADKVAVWGDRSKRVLMEHGVDVDAIVITGSPRNDFLHGLSSGYKERLRFKWGIPSGVVILMASTFNTKGYESYSDPQILIDMKKSIFKLAKLYSNINLIVKPHPSEDEGETRGLAEAANNIFFVSKDADIRELISFCDCFISFGSTATTDAILAEKIVICPAFQGWIWSNLFIETGAVLAPRSIWELEQLFRVISRGGVTSLSSELHEKSNNLVIDWFCRNDGQSVRRVHDLILEILLKGKNVEC